MKKNSISIIVKIYILCLKIQLIFTFSIVIAFTAFKTYARDIKIVGTDWEPFSASTLESGGVLTEIVVTAFKRKGYNAEIQWYPWKRCLVLTSKGERDVLMTAYYSEQRAKKYLYSDPLFQIDIGLVALKEAGISSYKSLRDLEKFTIGVTKNWVNSAEFDAANYLKKDVSLTHITTMRKLFGRRIDMIVTSIPVFQYEVNRMKYHSLSEVTILDPILTKNNLHILSGFKVADYKKIIQDFNEGLSEIKQDGSYGKIFSKHGF
ncbi:substrate-binding periplasmic protein [Spartinivicinus ruber]|uniref:substrate-binding periplasmic protein n=1 Tax=Spartinivicinus ruber TaxID=2683272 RepID=UPI0013CF56E4|nr:transporter substrate-binding domain-containing protein [Spartinivicinus ruber]